LRVYDRRTKGCATDGVGKTDRRTAQCDRSDRQPANRHPQPKSRAAEGEDQTERGTTDADETARETGDRYAAYRYVPNSDDTPCDSRAHRGWVQTRTHVNQRPTANTGTRSILESQDRSCLYARAAHEPGRFTADAFVAHRLLASSTEPDCGGTIMNETVH